MACGSVTANGLVVSPTLWQPQRDSNPCLHLERDVQGYVVTWGTALKPRWIAISLSAVARI